MKIYFTFLGFFSLLSQIVLLRELVTWLGGDELFYVLGLGWWLLLAGLGSLLLRHLQGLLKEFRGWYLFIFYPILSPIILVIFRYLLSRVLPVGQIPGLGQSVLLILLAIFLPAFFSGVLFCQGVNKWSDSTKGYLWETIGFFISGLIFTFLLSRTSFPLPKSLNRITMDWRYPSLEEVIYSKGSQLIVAEQNNQKTIFSAGQPVFNSQPSDFDQRVSQLLANIVHDPLRLSPRSGGAGSEASRELYSPGLVSGNIHLANFLNEKNSYQVSSLFSNEDLFDLQKDYLNKGVEAEVSDSRQYLTKRGNKFELIVFDSGSPTSLFINRYYTKEFFDLVEANLSQSGLFCLVFDLPSEYLSQEAEDYGQVVFNTFDKVFPKVELFLVEGRVVLVGSKVEIKKPVESTEYVDYLWEDKERLGLKNQLSGGDEINTDFRPLAYFKHHLFWQTIFSFQLPKLIRHLVWLIPISLFLILIDLVKSLDKKKLGVLMAVSGFILMSLETMLLFTFQTQFGYLYTYLGLIMGTVLLGMALGVKIIKMKKLPGLVTAELWAGQFKPEPGRLLLIYLLLGGLLLIDFWQEIIFIWLVLGLFIGLVGGMIFSLTNQRWLEESENQVFIYASDLFGSFLGAVLTSMIFLPKFGLPIFLLILALFVVVMQFDL